MNDDDLRDQLFRQLCWLIQTPRGPGDPSAITPKDARTILGEIMPVVRDALADAWDDGYEGGEDDTFKELRGIPTDRGHNERATNPWREDD